MAGETFSGLNLKRRNLAAPKVNFSPNQEAAIAHRNKPLIITGGPGSGKTTTLIEAAVARIAEGQDPNSILLLTFGRERASELRDAIALRTTDVMLEPLARTFHALAFSILKNSGANPILLSGPEQESWIRQLIPGVQWPAELQPALQTRGFVRELRDLILRATERGWDADKLARRGRELNEEFWVAAANFWKSYIGTLIFADASHGEPKERLDSSHLIWRASKAVDSKLRNRFKTILVDEFQESDKSQRQLLATLAPDDLVIAVDSYSTVGRFRGADPDGLDHALDQYLQRGQSIHLDQNFRASSSIHLLLEKIAGNFPKPPKIQSSVNSHAGAVIAQTFQDRSSEAIYIADQMQRAHLERGVKWADMAIIFRTPAQSYQVRRALMQSGIPVAGELQVLSENLSIAPFLLLAESAIRGKMDIATAEILLTSEFGGADSISFRRIRRELVAKYSDETKLTGTELIIAAITEGEYEIAAGAPLIRIHELFNKVELAASRREAQPEDVLWAAWSNAITEDNQKISDVWKQRALKGGVRGANADRDLDAMLQLFESARRFGQRFKYANLEDFFKDIRKAEIAGDVITAKGQRADVVEIHTPFSAKGREFKVVFIAGIQEGIWPNLQIRGSLLGSDRLVERDRHSDLSRLELDLVTKSAVAEDELRLFYSSASRASNELYFTAVEAEDDQPSQYFEIVHEHIAPENEHKPMVLSHSLNASAVIAKLRRKLLADGDLKAAATLKALASAGFAGVNPDEWYGAIPLSTNQPAVNETEQVPVSPSGVEKFDECQLRWFLEAHGGQNGNTTAQLIGTVIHKFAELAETTDTTVEQQIELLKENWRLVDPETGWISKSSEGRALMMLQRFYQYRQSIAGKRDFVAAEGFFEFEVGRAIVRGSIDRIEVTLDGSYFLIDFKTGKSQITKEEAKTDAQMQIYQLAISEGKFKNLEISGTSAGASLLYLSHDNKGVTTRDQDPIDKEAVKERIHQTAVKMGGATFIATENSNCKFCNVRSSCPLQIEGRGLFD